jgi:hypothetical protein
LEMRKITWQATNRAFCSCPDRSLITIPTTSYHSSCFEVWIKVPPKLYQDAFKLRPEKEHLLSDFCYHVSHYFTRLSASHYTDFVVVLYQPY